MWTVIQVQRKLHKRAIKWYPEVVQRWVLYLRKNDACCWYENCDIGQTSTPWNCQYLRISKPLGSRLRCLKAALSIYQYKYYEFAGSAGVARCAYTDLPLCLGTFLVGTFNPFFTAVDAGFDTFSRFRVPKVFLHLRNSLQRYALGRTCI
jgi:hypothetical protein